LIKHSVSVLNCLYASLSLRVSPCLAVFTLRCPFGFQPVLWSLRFTVFLSLTGRRP